MDIRLHRSVRRSELDHRDGTTLGRYGFRWPPIQRLPRRGATHDHVPVRLDQSARGVSSAMSRTYR